MEENRYHIVERLGEHQGFTREGFLVITDVPIARTGVLVYGPGELQDSRYGIVPTGPDGIIYAHRAPEDVFDPTSLSSIPGKPVVMDHPDDAVTPENWNEIAIGVGINPHRGTGFQDDLLLADLVITSKDAIPEVRQRQQSGMPFEVSCGYDAAYDQMEPGHVKQYNIIFNHIALVKSARCGPRCTVGDSKTVEEKQMTIKERLKKLFADKDERGFTAALDEINEGPVTLTTDQVRTVAKLVRDAEKEEEEKKDHPKDCDCAKCKDKKTMDSIAADVSTIKDSVKNLDSRMKKIEDAEKEEEAKEEKETEGRLEEEAPPGSGDKAKKAKDSSYLVDAWQETASFAEALAPGMKLSTMDAADSPKKTLDRMCSFRRTALELGANRPELRQFIDGLLGGKDIKALTCDQLRPIFKASGQYAMSVNNRDEKGGARHQEVVKKRVTIADVQKMNEEFYANQK
jgi:hypothetical protein